MGVVGDWEGAFAAGPAEVGALGGSVDLVESVVADVPDDGCSVLGVEGESEGVAEAECPNL